MIKDKMFWIILVIILALAGTGFFFRGVLGTLGSGQARALTGTPAREGGTVTVRPATDNSQVSAAGNIALISQQQVVVQVQGIVDQVAVTVGDEVAAGDLLVALDTTELDRAVERASLARETSQANLDQLLEPASPAAITSAEAQLASAQENLAELKAGPTAADLAAAEAALTAAQASYQDLVAGQSQAELTQLAAEMHKAYITLQQAQEAFNEVAYRGDVGSSQQALDLQNATIDYDTAKAAYEQATAPPSQADVQDRLRAIKEAQSQLEALKTTGANLAAAEAGVRSAEASLADLLDGPGEAERRAAELALQQAEIDLAEAEANLAQTRLLAPIAGTVLTVDAEVGQQVAAGLNVVILADISALELTINVAEVDISKIEIGRPAQITIDALPDGVFDGHVSRIAPTSTSDSGVVNYPVTIRLSDTDLSGVRPGMTAVAALLGDTPVAQWLVPTNALKQDGPKTVVMVVREGRRIPVEVKPGSSQGEWTTVQGPELQAGDQVVGQVSSFLDQDGGGGGFRGPFGGAPPR